MLASVTEKTNKEFSHLKANEKIVKNVDFEQILAPLCRTEDAVARLDERLRLSPILVGWNERSHFEDACASLWVEGSLAHREDLVLHDARMDVRAPTEEIFRASRVLAARRRIYAATPDWALSVEGLATLRGGSFLENETDVAGKARGKDGREEENAFEDDEDPAPNDPLAAELAALDLALAGAERALKRRLSVNREDRDPLVYDLDWDEGQELAQWREAVNSTTGLPPVLAATLAAVLWDEMEPLQRMPWLGRLLVGALLRERGKTKSFLLPVSSGVRGMPRLRSKSADRMTKVQFWLEAIFTAAEQGLKDHDRWLLARASRLEMLRDKNENSHLSRALEVVLSRPLVTAEFLAQELDVSARAARNLIAELGVRELTGRQRYRAWGIF